jgi:hypothetical protein
MKLSISSIIMLIISCSVSLAAELADLPAGPQIDRATGFFHTKKVDGKWWMVDPSGRAFYMIGTDHVNYNGHWCETLGYAPYGRNAQQKYGSEEKWIQTQFERLSSWGFNALPYAAETMRRRKFPHVETLSLGTSFGDVDGLSPKTTWTGFPNVFNPEWPKHCDHIAREHCNAVKNDPWVLGYFLDNELEWYSTTATGLFGEAWKRPASDPAKQGWLAFLATQCSAKEFSKHWGIPITSFQELAGHQQPVEPKTEKGKAIVLAFIRLVADRYFSTCAEAIKRYDPHHMIFGCRFASRAPAIWDIAGKYCDVLTFNYYKWIDLKRGVPAVLVEELSEWHRQAKKPMMCTEWSFPALDAGLPCLWGGGMRVDTQEQRAQCFSHFQTMLFSLPFIVGSSYFMYIDEPAQGISHTFPEDCNYGLLDVNDNVYPEITEAAARLNARVYDIHAKGEMVPLSGKEKIAGWISQPSGKSVTPVPSTLNVQAGALTLHGPVDGHAWRLYEGKTLLGDLVAYIEQDVGNWLWVPTDSCRIVSMRENSRATTVDMEMISRGKGPLITRLTVDPSRPPADQVKPGHYRGVWRFVIPKQDGEWISMQCLWFENIDQTAWTSKMSYLFLIPAVGGHVDNDKALYAPDMHFYYVTGAAWVDASVGTGVGCWFKQQPDVECTFWIDRLGRYRSDMRNPALALLQPGQRYSVPGAIAFFFPLHGVTRASYEAATDRLQTQVLTN